MAKDNDERRKLYQKRKKTGLCPRCGKRKKKSETYSYCDACREFFREVHARRAARINKEKRKIYKQRKSQGKCTRCGVKLPKNYINLICRNCLNKQYK